MAFLEEFESSDQGILNPGGPLRYHRTTGLMITQVQELVRRVNEALDKPWNMRTGRPESLGMHKAVEAACMYLRQEATSSAGPAPEEEGPLRSGLREARGGIPRAAHSRTAAGACHGGSGRAAGYGDGDPCLDYRLTSPLFDHQGMVVSTTREQEVMAPAVSDMHGRRTSIGTLRNASQ
jgi:hypothetical protein